MVMSQTCWQAPTYIPESLKLLAYSWFQVPGPAALEEKMPYWAAVASAVVAGTVPSKKVDVAVR